MRNYVAVIFDEADMVCQGLRGIWYLDRLGRITILGAAAARRTARAELLVATKKSLNPIGIPGVGAGALIDSVLAAAQAKMAGQGGYDADGALALQVDQATIIAEVSEAWTAWINEAMHELGARVYRRPASDVRPDEWYYRDWCTEGYFYPYQYIPAGDDWS